VNAFIHESSTDPESSTIMQNPALHCN